MLSPAACPGTLFMRTNVALAVFLFMLAACLAPHARERQQPEPASGERKDEAPPTVRAPRSPTTRALGAAASPDLRWLMQRPFALDPMPQRMTGAREEVRRYRAHRPIDSGTAAERAEAAEALRAATAASGPRFGRVVAVEGSRVAIQFESTAAARAMFDLGSFYDPDGYKGEVELVERLGRLWLARVAFLRPEESVRVGDFVCQSLSR